MKVGITGARGFVAWHLRCELLSHGITPTLAHRAEFEDASELARFLSKTDVVVHAAGINRSQEDKAIWDGNVGLAQRLVDAVQTLPDVPALVFLNTTHAITPTNIYGESKARAAQLLKECWNSRGAQYQELILPHVYGEFGRPHYNSAVATFVDAIAQGSTGIEVNPDGELELAHVRDVCAAVVSFCMNPSEGAEKRRLVGERASVPGIWEALRLQCEIYTSGVELPRLDTELALGLFNALRAALWQQSFYPRTFEVFEDPRGGFFEAARSSTTAQTSISVSAPGVTRGDHFHLRKVERFVVVRGQAILRVRRLLTDELVEYPLSGADPVFVDIPPLCTHNITNVGEDELITLFVAGDHFDPQSPDTFPQVVGA